MKSIENTFKKNGRLIAVVQFVSIWYMPIFIFFVVWMIADNYISTTDISFEYLGKEPINLSEINSVEIYGVNDFQAYIADSKEEYRNSDYGKLSGVERVCALFLSSVCFLKGRGEKYGLLL